MIKKVFLFIQTFTLIIMGSLTASHSMTNNDQQDATLALKKTFETLIDNYNEIQHIYPTTINFSLNNSDKKIPYHCVFFVNTLPNPAYVNPHSLFSYTPSHEYFIAWFPESKYREIIRLLRGSYNYALETSTSHNAPPKVKINEIPALENLINTSEFQLKNCTSITAFLPSDTKKMNNNTEKTATDIPMFSFYNQGKDITFFISHTIS